MQVGINDDDRYVCQLDGCSQTDLLTAHCSNCGKAFCSAHISSSAHHCTAVPDAVALSCPLCGSVVPREYPEQPADDAVSRHMDRGCRDAPAPVPAGGPRRLGEGTVWRCGHGSCDCTDELQKVQCDGCGRSFCLRHRNPEAHQCPRAARKPRVSEPATHSSARPRSESPATKATIAQLLQQPRNTLKTAAGKATESPDDMVTPLVCFVVPTAASNSSGSAALPGVSADNGAAGGGVAKVAAVPSFFLHIAKTVVVGRALDQAVAEASKHSALLRKTAAQPWRAHVIRVPVPEGAVTAAQYPPVPLSAVVGKTPLAEGGPAVLVFSQFPELPDAVLSAVRSSDFQKSGGGGNTDNCRVM